MGSWGISTTSPGEFYAGANSTGTAAAPVYRTAAPAPRTLYWVGGNGNWSSLGRWSLSSGGTPGEQIPTSLDAVIFDSASNATAYTATIDVGVALARCAAFTMAGPAAGNVTFAGTVGIAYHGNVSFAATGITRSYTGAINLAGNSSYAFTTNGLVLANNTTVIGISSTWTLGSALDIGSSSLTVTYGIFDTSASNYTLTCLALSSNNSNIRSILLNASSILASGNILFGSTTNLTFSVGTSQINLSGTVVTFAGGGQTFYNVSFTSGTSTSISISGANTFNILSIAARASLTVTPVTFSADQVIGTLTTNAGGSSTGPYRTFLTSDVIGIPRTLTVTTLGSLTDIDFRDITIAGAASPASGTRLGDCKGNSGITFPAAKTVYYRQTGSADWGTASTGSWSLTSGGAFDATAFPLAQDTAVFPAATYPASGSTTTINASYNIGTIDMSLRTTNTMTLATGSNSFTIYGSWINGTGTTVSSGSTNLTFAGRTTQNLTSAGKAFNVSLSVNSPGGSLVLQDSFVNNRFSLAAFSLSAGTINANNYNVTLTTSSGVFSTSGTATRTIAMGSGTWLIQATIGTPWSVSGSNITITGTATISLTGAATKIFAGGGFSYSGITLNQGSAGALTISGDNTFANITNTSGVATTINLAATTQTVGAWTAKGTAGNLLTITGTSAAAPATLIYTGGGGISGLDYLVPTSIRAYPTTSTWYAGANSTNGGSLGWIFAAYVPPTPGSGNGNFLVFF